LRVQIGPEAQPDGYAMGIGTFSVGTEPSVRLTTRLNVVPRSRMSGAIPSLPLYAFMACTENTPMIPLMKGDHFRIGL
jgi:hypothetical protein